MDTKQPAKCARQGCHNMVRGAALVRDAPPVGFCSNRCYEAEQKLEQKLVPKKEERLKGDSNRTEETL